MASPNAAEIKKIADDLTRYIGFIQKSMDAKVAEKIAKAVTEAMLDLIAKGISPIEGQGRFPAYKWAAFRNEVKKQRSSITKALRAEKSKPPGRRMNQRQITVALKQSRRDESRAGQGYPFSVQKEFPNKKPRPVNLFLSGDFLRALRGVVTGSAGALEIEIGFFSGSKDAKGVEAWVKEQGHREGANGQPERPIIPVGTEDFVQSIQNAIWEIIEEEIDRATRVGSF